MRSQRNLAGKNFRSVDNVCPLAAQDEADAKNQAAAYLLAERARLTLRVMSLFFASTVTS